MAGATRLSPLTPTWLSCPYAYIAVGGLDVAAVTQAMSQHSCMPSIMPGAYQPVPKPVLLTLALVSIPPENLTKGQGSGAGAFLVDS